jgi:hypothetical protein
MRILSLEAHTAECIALVDKRHRQRTAKCSNGEGAKVQRLLGPLQRRHSTRQEPKFLEATLEFSSVSNREVY